MISTRQGYNPQNSNYGKFCKPNSLGTNNLHNMEIERDLQTKRDLKNISTDPGNKMAA